MTQGIRPVERQRRPELREAESAHAERVLKAELSRRGWSEAELGRRRKGDPEKVAMASQLRARTTMTLKWIARRLKMGAGPTSQTVWCRSASTMNNVNSYD